MNDLPSPDGRDDDGAVWWRLSTGERIYAHDGNVFSPNAGEDADRIEQDALAHLAAVAAARNP